MKFLTLAACALALAVLPSSSAFADTFSFSFTGPLYSGSGTFTTDPGVAGPLGSTEFDITGITGTVTTALNQTSTITGLSLFDGADNELFDPGLFGVYNLDTNGVSFTLSNSDKVNLSSFGLYYAQANVPFSTEAVTFSVTDTTTAPPAVPEPSSIALLGTGLLAAAGAVRRRFTA